FSRPIVVLMTLVAILFLITCSNLASLLFVRALRRAGELSVRVAVGAARGQLVAQWIMECLIIAVPAGIAGIAIAPRITDFLLAFVPADNRSYLRFQPSPVITGFAVALTSIAVLLMGYLPAFRASRQNSVELLRTGAGGTAPRDLAAARWVLSGQLAASLILV